MSEMTTVQFVDTLGIVWSHVCKDEDETKWLRYVVARDGVQAMTRSEPYDMSVRIVET